jgi:glutamate N-acetyltransferase/amino-acid N-acetyltransferase
MAVRLGAPTALAKIAGVRLGTAAAAIKRPDRDDVVVIELVEGSRTAGVFTRNAFAAAPVLLCRERLAAGHAPRALLINSGNANAATGPAGLQDARASCEAVASALGCSADRVLPFSTGVIGQRLPLDRLKAGAARAAAGLRDDGWLDAAAAIMTTDTVAKGVSRGIVTPQGEITVTGIAKGVGMLHPDMATLLAFIATDARLSAAAVRHCLTEAVGRSFNCATVDGDTSTNDSCVLMATAQVGDHEIEIDDPDYPAIAATIEAVCVELAQAVVRDGEGATKFITIDVGGARRAAEARQVALSIAHSPLVKTAMFAGDANWGRIVMAVGKAGVDGLDPTGVSIALDDVTLIRSGVPDPDYEEQRGAAVVAKPEFTIRVDLGRGVEAARIWTCDFSYDYVRINAEYRT